MPLANSIEREEQKRGTEDQQHYAKRHIHWLIQAPFVDVRLHDDGYRHLDHIVHAVHLLDR